jgi:hypothetical protein
MNTDMLRFLDKNIGFDTEFDKKKSYVNENHLNSCITWLLIKYDISKIEDFIVHKSNLLKVLEKVIKPNILKMTHQQIKIIKKVNLILTRQRKYLVIMNDDTITFYKNGTAKPTHILLQDKNYNYVVNLKSFQVNKMTPNYIKTMPFIFFNKKVTNAELLENLPSCPTLADVSLFYKTTKRYKIVKMNITNNNIDFINQKGHYVNVVLFARMYFMILY